MNKFFGFMGSMSGRITRIILGMFILAFGFVQNPIWLIVGLIPFLAGIFDFCVFAPLFGLPFVGEKLRAKLNK